MARANLTILGWSYIGVTIGWSIILLCGMFFLWSHRQLPFLQIRRLPLVFTALVLLHIYGAACMVAFTIGPLVPCDAQFWVMSVYLPFGMALLQAANSQFLHVASQQKKFAQLSNLEEKALPEKSAVDPSLGWWKRAWLKVWKVDKTTRTVIFIGIGMVLEVRDIIPLFVSVTLIRILCSWHLPFLSTLARRCFTQDMASSTSRSLVPRNKENSSASRGGNGTSSTLVNTT
jgi:hypothetical protein